MANPKDVINIGVWVSQKSLPVCSSRGVRNLLASASDPAALEFLTLALEDAGFKYRFTCVASEMLPFSVEHQNASQGMIDQVKTGNIDIAAAFFSYSKIRSEWLAYTQLFRNVSYAFVVRKQDLKLMEGAALLLRALSCEVWLAWLVTALILIFSFSFVKQAVENYKKRESFMKAFVEKGWLILRFTLGQYINLETRRVSNGILFFLLANLTLTMVNMYQTVMFHQLSIMATRPPFHSTEELVALVRSGRLKLVTSSNDSAYFDQLHRSGDYHFALMRRALKLNPLKTVPTFRETIDLVTSEEGGHVLVADVRYARQLAAFCCCLTVVDLEVPHCWSGFIMNRGRSRLLKHRLDEALLRVLGRFDQLENRPLNAPNPSLDGNCQNAKFQPLRLITFNGLFVVCGILVGLAGLCLCVERCSVLMRHGCVGKDHLSFAEKAERSFSTIRKISNWRFGNARDKDARHTATGRRSIHMRRSSSSPGLCLEYDA